MKQYFRTGRKAFTLVELLIVVAIIGILSTVGIPTFKKMVQKAKKSEAKVALGGLYTAEAAFFSEYGVYGSFLDKIGFEMSGGGGQTYTLGFTDDTCKGQAIMPDKTVTAGKNLDSVYPSYFNPAPANDDSVLAAKGSRPPTACGKAIPQADGSSFIAVATGLINPNGDAAKVADMDLWTVDQNRAVANSQDGVK